MNKHWYAVYTKPQAEKKVSGLLTKKKILNLCPMNNITIRQGSRIKETQEPLFPTFVFVYISEAEMQEVRKTTDVMNFVYWLGRPAVIKAAEIDSIASFSAKYQNIKVEKAVVNAAGIVKITSEPLHHPESGFNDGALSLIRLSLPSIGFTLKAHTEKETTGAGGYRLERTGMQA